MERDIPVLEKKTFTGCRSVKTRSSSTYIIRPLPCAQLEIIINKCDLTTTGSARSEAIITSYRSPQMDNQKKRLSG